MAGVAETQLPSVKHGDKRAITFEEHQKIINREYNPAIRAYYELLWYLGGAQTDLATLTADDINWKDRTIAYRRHKTAVTSLISFGNEVAAILEKLPDSGELFPALARLHERHRAKMFIKRLATVGISGVSLHSYRYAWAERAAGSDLDDRHHSFFDRHPDQVQSYKLGSDDESKSTLLGLFRNVLRNDALVHVIDCRAQGDGLIVQALDSLQIISSLATEGIRFTFFLFPSEDTESMNNLLELFNFAGDRVDYVIVHDPAKVRTNLFKKSNIEAELKKFGAREITLPTVTSITLLAIKRAEAKAGRKLSFAEAATAGTPHLELMLAGEMQWAMQQMFRQYDLIADLLVPSEQVLEVEPPPEPEAKPARSKQPMLNLGE